MILFTVSFLFTKLADLRLYKIPLLFSFLFLLLSFAFSAPFFFFFSFLSNDHGHGGFIWLVQASTICIIY